jgi:hypothetical protein
VLIDDENSVPAGGPSPRTRSPAGRGEEEEEGELVDGLSMVGFEPSVARPLPFLMDVGDGEVFWLNPEQQHEVGDPRP